MNVNSLVMEWLRYAKSDLNTAHHMFEDVYPKEIEIACWHSQQCVEKSLKAFLVFNEIESPRTHDLIELCQLCQGYNASFTEISAECRALNPYGVNVRYPNELAVDDIITKTAIERAQKVYEFCVAIVSGGVGKL